MSLSLTARNLALLASLIVAAPVGVLGQTNYLPQGAEYAIAGSLAHDQGRPELGLDTSGGYLVWQDVITDGAGLGISALRLDSGLSGVYSPFRVNAAGAGDQENAQVSLLKGGGCVFVWQGGPQGFQRIYARFLSAGHLWLTGDVQVNSFNGNSQVNPAVATLANSNAVVVWASFNQAAATSLQDVYAQLLSPAGEKIGGEFRVNQAISFNQRHPAVAALSDGRFVVAWVSEQQRSLAAIGDVQGSYATQYGTASVDVYARIYTASGTPSGNEFLVSTNSNIASSPQVAAGAGSAFMVVWAERSRLGGTNGWDICGTTVSGAGLLGPTRCLNTTRFGDQYLPRVSWDGSDYMVLWTGLGQDGSREGVFGQLLHDDGTPDQGEFQINTTWLSQQMEPALASDGQGRFLAVWTSYVGGASGFDLYAQRYVNVAQPLPAMDAPFVHVPFVVSNGVYQPRVQVSWPVQAGLSVAHYGVYVGGTLAASLATNVWVMPAAPSTSYSFQVDYVTTSGRRSPLSPPADATTWDGQIFQGVLPVQWMARYWGYGNIWPRPNEPVAPGGPTVWQVFLTGADPMDPSTWLRTAIIPTAQGYFLSWNPRPGLTYQVQASSDLTEWVDTGSPRFAAGSVDYLYIGLSHAGYYRVKWLH